MDILDNAAEKILASASKMDRARADYRFVPIQQVGHGPGIARNVNGAQLHLLGN